ncbi:MAG: glycosyltransferase [Lamprobacter sp.]|uniref:glycosyltransferase n=1 Tax=Lamprobacter sp. TaxID=3100796 RepID=UPI002B25D63B|nr:glycosyltransferase [Lamprobacter sp.]MEA3640807.1 glycosyltransferase [Lamprobacter sp.]
MSAPATPREPRFGRGAILYDFLHCQGGAEQLSLDLLETFPGAELWVGYRDQRWFPDQRLHGARLRDLHLPARFPGGRTLLGLLGFRVRTRRLATYDWALFSGSVTVEAVHQRPQGRNLYYCHTVPRFAYDLQQDYAARLPRAARPVLGAAAAGMRYRYQKALAKMDLIMANSENVRARLQRYLGLDARVIYPPCDTQGPRWLGQNDDYLSTARLEPYKRVDLLIEAFRKLPGHQLCIASGGSDERRLRRLAAGAANIRFTGWLDGSHLRSLIGHCIATVYVAKDEDFGMSPVESMAAGKPVIGVAEGGLLETITDGVTGLLIQPPLTADKVIEAILQISPSRALEMRQACEQRACLFSKELFAQQMRQAVAEVAHV